MSYTQKANLVIELNVDCPECKESFNLLETSSNDEGQLYKQVLEDERWLIDPDERLETTAYCPHCSSEFEVKGVIW